MLINIFDDYQTARNACVAYQRCGKRHQGLRGVEYRVYFYNGKYRVWRGRDYTDFPNCAYGPVFSDFTSRQLSMCSKL